MIDLEQIGSQLEDYRQWRLNNPLAAAGWGLDLAFWQGQRQSEHIADAAGDTVANVQKTISDTISSIGDTFRPKNETAGLLMLAGSLLVILVISRR